MKKKNKLLTAMELEHFVAGPKLLAKLISGKLNPGDVGRHEALIEPFRPWDLG